MNGTKKKMSIIKKKKKFSTCTWVEVIKGQSRGRKLHSSCRPFSPSNRKILLSPGSWTTSLVVRG